MPHSTLLASADDEWSKADARASPSDIHGPHPTRAIHLVGGHAQDVDAHCVDVNGFCVESNACIDVEDHSPVLADGTHRSDVLDRADLVVCKDHRDQDGVFPDRITQRFGCDQPSGVDRQVGRLKTLSFQ